MRNDAEIIIGTKVDNSGLEKGLKETEKIVKDFDRDKNIDVKDNKKEIESKNKIVEKDNEILNKEIEINKEIEKRNTLQQGIQDALKENGIGIGVSDEDGIKMLASMVREQAEQAQQEAEIEPRLDLKQIQQEKVQLLNEIAILFDELNEKAKINPEMSEEDLLKDLASIDQLIDKVDLLDTKIAQLNSSGFQDLSSKIDGIGNKVSSVIGKVGRWALALFGVQSILSLVTSSMSVLSSKNQELATKINNIKLALATALEPIINRLINLVVKLLSYLNYITKTFFGIDIFARAAELSTKNIAENMGSAASSASEIRKQLAGFDEMNVLGDNVGSSGGGGGGAGISPEDYDFLLQEQEVPKWFKDLVNWLKENYKWLLAVAGAIGGIVLASKGLNFLNSIFEGLTGFGTPMKILLGVLAKIALEAGSLYLLFKSMQSAQENTDGSTKGLLKSSGLLYGSMVLMTGVGNPLVATLEGIAGGVYILNQYMNNSEATVTNLDRATQNLTKAQKKQEETIEHLNEVQGLYNNTIDNYENAVKNAETAQKQLTDAQNETGISGEELFNSVKNGELTYLNMNDAQKKVYKAYLNNVDAQNTLNEKTAELTETEKELKKSEENVEKATDNVRKKQLELSLATQLADGDFEGFKKTIVDAMGKGELKAGEAQKYISQAMAGMSDSSRKTFTKDLPDDLKNGLDPSKYETKGQKLQKWFSKLSTKIGELFSKLGGNIGESIWGGIKGVINYAISTIENMLNAVVGLINKAIPTINKIPGVNLERLKWFNLPRLAKGAIINQPGRGVPVGGAFAGEAGREGILPLTDSRAMAELGREIGKWITVNANIPVSIGNRQIARLVKQLMAEDDFAMNN